MQLSARILTALAVLAFTVAVVAGSGVTKEVSAATGTIDALNLGTCTTTNADVFSFGDDCLQPEAFFQQNPPLEDLIEVDTLYATYAHDPRTAAESPRAILDHSDHILVSVTDTGRDRRDAVVIATAMETLAPDGNNGVNFDFDHDGVDNTDLIAVAYHTVQAAPDADTPVEGFSSRSIVAEVVGFDDPLDLPEPEQEVQFDGGVDLGTPNATTYVNSGTYEIIWERETDPPETDDFKPIAPDGVVKFFGRVDDGIDNEIDGFGPFKDIGANISLDEDVISGEPNEPPVMTLNISVPDGRENTSGMVQLQVIYYETSGIEFIIGGGTSETGDICIADLHLEEAGSRTHQQATCTADEIDDDAGYVLHAESDEDAADDKRHLALIETGRFTGVFQGTLRLTDADGNGDGENWGRAKGNASYTEADLAADPAVPGSTTDAVLGVGNGPVTITYKDTDGQNRTYQIEVDITPPTISVDSPAHGGRSDDEKPSFFGTFNDSDSGLQANSFQLDVDNTRDQGDDKPVIFEASGVSADGQVRRRQDYTGYDDPDGTGLYGIIAGDIYKVEDVPENSDTAEDYKSLEADDFDDGAADGEFNGEIEIDFDEFLPDDTDFIGFNNAVDFQALVRDLAGNVGFSDSDPTGPRFINALGEEKEGDRDPDGEKNNVIGVFARHVVYIDELDPYIMADASVTGFYTLDDDDIPVRDRSAVMVVFDNSVNGELIDTGTFTVEHDEETAVEVVDVEVDGKLVFLKLGEELASDATPSLTITEGREVEDLAGNLLTWQEPLDGKDNGIKVVEVKDGILPVLTVTLSGGSGTGVGSESPSKLTNAAIDIAIESDEDINGSPKVAVVCSNIQWITDLGTADETTTKLAGYIGNRTGYDDDTSGETATGLGKLSCGGDDDPADFRESSSLSRPGNNWVYAWRNASAPARHLNDGKLVVVVWGRDRSSFDEHKDDFCDTDDNAIADQECDSWGSTTAEFTLDSIFPSPLNADGSGGSVQPEADSEVKEPRPFVYLDFAGETTSVTVTELSVDGEDVRGDLDSVGDNRFLYWPEALAFGTHKVEFDARDAADNEPDGRTSFEFDVTARDPFVIDLTAGWNAISFPANPVDTALDAVFTEEAVDRVVGWNPLSATGPWSIATRIDGVWTTSANFAPLTDVVVRYGYWVHSMAFIEQSVDLEGQLNRETDGIPDPVGIATVPGWNFVGVVDQDGDQTEDNFGDPLEDSEDVVVIADDYMPGFRQAYTWDAIGNGYRVLDGGAPMKIGKGIWVFFPDGDNLAP